MADHFLSKIQVTNSDLVETGGSPVLDRFDELRNALTERAGPEVAALFAEPLISRGNDTAPATVSWYCDMPGEARALSQLSRTEQDRVEAYLADHLRPVHALLDDPATADLARGALSVYGADDILVVDGVPVIVNWGLLPDGKGASALERTAHYGATLGRYLPLRGPGAAVTPPPVPPAGAVPPAPPAQDPHGPELRPEPRITAIAWVPLLILLLLAGATLAWLLMPGTRLFHRADTPPAVTDQASLNAARALNDSLRERQATLEAALEGAVCRADGVLIVPGGLTPEGLTPPALGVAPDKKANAAPDALLPNAAGRVLVPDPQGAAGSNETTLLDLIEARTVLVLATHGGQLTTGSGFAVGTDLVVTNQHVIAPALGEAGQIIVTGGALDRPHVATIVKSDGPVVETGRDFALLRVEGADLAPFTVLDSDRSLKLNKVVAAGFPGDVLEMDINFAALKAGDLSAVPELTVTDGTVNTRQKIGPKTSVLMHSAALSSGNSGGPLVDMCGRLVGVNTFVKQGRMQNRGFALTGRDLLGFLAGTPATPATTGDDCAPVVVRAQAATSKQPDPATDQKAKE